MTTVPLAQARQQLSGLLDRIQAGEYVVISRHVLTGGAADS
jgi:antitoxin (DNA-binding transcriptional repressor) of toxin-antitoxin stability system